MLAVALHARRVRAHAMSFWPLIEGAEAAPGGMLTGDDDGSGAEQSRCWGGVLKGEAEETLPQFVKSLEAGDEDGLSEVPGLTGMRDGELWVDNPAPPLIKKLDDLPFPKAPIATKLSTKQITRFDLTPQAFNLRSMHSTARSSKRLM